MKQTMSKQAWRDLWLEIAELYDDQIKMKQKYGRYYTEGICMLLGIMKQDDLQNVLRRIVRQIGLSAYLYTPQYGSPDPVRAFTACFIAEIGEREFIKLAEEQNDR